METGFCQPAASCLTRCKSLSGTCLLQSKGLTVRSVPKYRQRLLAPFRAIRTIGCVDSKRNVSCASWNRQSSSSWGRWGGSSNEGSASPATSRAWRSDPGTDGDRSHGGSNSSSPDPDSSRWNDSSSQSNSSSSSSGSSYKENSDGSLIKDLMAKVAGWLGGPPGDPSVRTGTRSSIAWEQVTSPYVLVAFLPVVVFCVAWSFTTGMASLADACLTGLCSISQQLYPSLPMKGVSYEDVAVALIKAIQTSTDDPSTWSRAGAGLPGWAMRGAMCTFYGLAVASTSLSTTFRSVPLVFPLTGVSICLLYVLCLLLMLPVGRGLHSLIQTTMPKAPVPRLKPVNGLTLKLLGVLCWPCISAAAVAKSLQQDAPATATAAAAAAGFFIPSLGSITLQVAVGLCSILLLLTAAGCVLWFGWGVVNAEADAAAVMDWGLQVGVLCGCQLLLNMVQFGIGVMNSALNPGAAVPALLSMLILGRLAWSLWQLSKHQEPVLIQAWMDVLDSSLMPTQKDRQ